MHKVTEKLDEISKKLQDAKYFRSSEDYALIEKDLVEAFREGDLSKIEIIVNETDLRRIPMTDGENRRSEIGLLNQYAYLYWPATLVMVNSNRAAEEKQIAVFDFILTSGFGIRQAVRQSD